MDEDRKRQERNEKIVRALERIESRVNSLMSKTERFKILRRQYKSYLDSISTRSKNNNYCRDEGNFPTRLEEYSNEQVQKNEFAEKFDKDKDEKMAILDRYLKNFRSEDLESKHHPPSTEQHHFRKDNDKLKTLDDLSKRLSQTFDSNKANSIAEDIMNSIYNRHYKKDIDPFKIVQKRHPTEAEGPKVSDYGSDNEDYDLDFREKKMHPKEKSSYFQNGKNEKEPHIPHYELNNDNNLKNPLKNELLNITDRNSNNQLIKKTYKNAEQDSDENFHENTNSLRKKVDFGFPDKTFTEKSHASNHVCPDSNNELNPVQTSQNIRNKLDNENQNGIKNKQIKISDSEDSITNDDKNTNKANFPNSQSTYLNNAVENDQVGGFEINQDHNRQNERIQSDRLNDSDSYKNDKRKEEEYNNENIEPIEDTYCHQSMPGQILDESSSQQLSKQQSVDIIEPHRNENEPKHPQDHKEIHQHYADNSKSGLGENNEISHPAIQDQYDQQHFEDSQPNQQYDENGQRTENFDETVEKIKNQQPEINNKQLNQYYEENGEKLPYEHYDQSNESLHQQFDENSQPVYQQYDENGQPILHQQYGNVDQENQHYDNNGKPVQQQYDENGEPLLYQQYGIAGAENQQYDDNGQPVPYQQYANTEPENHLYDGNGQTLLHQQYDEYGQSVNQESVHQYDENGHVVDQQYSENDQQHHQQYDEKGHLINEQYDENGHPIIAHQQYDGNGELLNQQYDENGHPVLHQQYDENGQTLYQQYDENGQPILVEQQQYDENGQPYLQQYDEYSQPLVHFDKDALPLNQQYDENGQPIIETQYDEHGQPIYQQYDENGQAVAYPQAYDANNYEQTQEQFAAQGNIQENVEPNSVSDFKDENSSNLEGADVPQGNENTDSMLNENIADIPVVDIKKANNVLDLLDTDTESAKQNTSKISHDDSDFDFSNG